MNLFNYFHSIPKRLSSISIQLFKTKKGAITANLWLDNTDWDDSNTWEDL